MPDSVADTPVARKAERVSASAAPWAGEDLLSLPAVAALLEGARPALVAAVGPGLEVLAVGGTLLADLHLPSERLVGARLPDLTSDPVLAEVLCGALAGRPCRGDTTVAGRTGRVIAEPLRLADDTTVAVCTLCFDDPAAVAADPTSADELEKFAAVVELSGDFIAMTDLEGRLSYLNGAGRRLVGLGPTDDVTGLLGADLVPEAARQRLGEEQRAIQEEGRWEGETHVRHLVTGEAIPVSGSSFLVRSATGEPLAMATVRHDLRARLAVEKRQVERAQEQRALAELGRYALTEPLPELLEAAVTLIASRYPHLACSISRCSEDGAVAHVVATSLSRHAEHGEVAVPLDDTSLAGTAVRQDRTVASADLTEDERVGDRNITASFGARAAVVCPIPGFGAPWGTVGVSDTEPRTWTEDDLAFVESVAAILGAAVRRFELEGELQHQALHDHLTGLPNRALLQDRIEHALARAARYGGGLAVLLLDLDDFKTINDSLGHGAGDELLAEVAFRLRQAVRSGDTVGRLGGDEFVVICEDVRQDDEVAYVAERILQACAPAVRVTGRAVSATVSIGVALAHHGEKSTTDLLSEADIAMYRAKRDRPGSYRVFDEAMRGEVLGRLNVAGDLRAALRRGSIEVAYQPIVDLRTGRVEAMEALARWTTERGEVIPPDVFVPVAEETGLIGDLGHHVLGHAAHDAVAWQEHGPVGLRVNVSAHELRSGSYFAAVQGALVTAGLAPSLLGLELTESLFVDEDKSTLDNLARLREAGLTLLLDDFGTGYSSLSYLHRFPLMDALKIDRSFLRDTQGEAVIRAVVSLGEAFGLSVCAEGVETPEQLARVRRLGCTSAQGYYFAPPVRQEAALALLADGRTWPAP